MTKWIDLTDLANWHGHMTGIQRTVYSIAKEYAEDKNVKYFIFNPKAGFSEVDFYKTTEPSLSKARSFRPHIVRRYVSFTRRATLKVARKVKKELRVGLKYAYKASPESVRRLGREVLLKRRVKKEVKIIPDITYPFEGGDILLLLGASWNEPSIIANLSYVKSVIPIKIVHLVYDLIPELFPQFFGEGFGASYVKHMFNAVSLSDRLLAISKNTKKDTENFIEKTNLPAKPIDVIRLGDEPTLECSEKSPHKGIEPRGYVLAVGTFEIRKNYQALYYIWKMAQQQGIVLPKLVIVGRLGWLAYETSHQMWHDPSVSESIIILDNVNDKDLAWLYANSEFTMYPSWYEGWGLPIAESLNYGKLCIASNTSSMIEIAPNLVEHFDPYDPRAGLELVLKYVNNPQLLKETENRIKTNYKRVTWDSTHKEIDAVISGM